MESIAFSGPDKATRYRDRGVYGTAAAARRTVVVPDVDPFPGYIVCDAGSRSEIVAPIAELLGALSW